MLLYYDNLHNHCAFFNFHSFLPAKASSFNVLYTGDDGCIAVKTSVDQIVFDQ